MDPHLHTQPSHMQPIAQQTRDLPPPRWQPDRRAASAGPGRPAHEQRSGADKRRQPRMPPEARQIYPD